MNYTVLDLEFNQPFNFKNGAQTYLNPECPFEIIQIGAVKLNENFELVDSFNYLIKPKIYKRIHPIVEKITGITYEQIKDCPSFEDAYNAFIEFSCGTESVLCTWGIDDIKSLYRNILFYNLNINAISDKYINVQTYATSYLNYEQGKIIGLKNAVMLLELPIEEEFHNALYDADYTAQIFKIVRPENVDINTFNIMDLTKKATPHKRINTSALMSHFESSLERELTKEEVSLIKSAYKLGRNQTYDIAASKYKNNNRRSSK